MRKLEGRLAGINPVAWFYNWKQEIEPFYILNWKNIHPASKVNANKVQFATEKNYDMDGPKFKQMLTLRMTDNLITSERFKFDKKMMLYIALAIAGVIAYWFFFLKK